MRKKALLYISTVVALSGLTSSYAKASNSCQQLFSADRNYNQKIFAKGIDSRTKNGHFQISYEAEYLFSESAHLLRDYAPPESVMKLKDWNALSDAEHIKWIKSKFSDKPEFATQSGLRRVVDVDFLPEELIVDSTGNLEIVINPPLDTYKEWETVVDYITHKYGAGSQQAMVSKPREAGFANGKESKNRVEQHLGWLNYTNLYDMFEKLNQGYTRFQKDPSKLTALSFDHPFVGPMNKIKRDVLENYLDANSRLEKYDDDAKLFVRKNDASFKYTSGPSYRPDVAGPYRWSWEIRNAHKDVQGLKAKVLRDIEAHTDGLENYQPFAKVLAFDSISEFNKLPEHVQTALPILFPSKAEPNFQYTAEEKIVLETYRNFAMPLMDMKVLIKSLSTTNNESLNLRKYNLARLKYTDGISQVVQEFQKHKISSEMAKAQIMGLIGKWSYESGIFELFLEKAKELNHDKSIKNSKAIKQAS